MRAIIACGASGNEDARRAVTALKPIALQEGCLHWMKRVTCAEAFNRENVLPLACRRKRQARQDTLTVDDDRACAASALIAPLLATCESERVAKCVQQC